MSYTVFDATLRHAFFDDIRIDWLTGVQNNYISLDYNQDRTIITIKIQNKEFIMDVIEGMYRTIESDSVINDQLDFYAGNHIEGDDVNVLPMITSSSEEWGSIVMYDAAIQYARVIAYTKLSSMFYDSIPRYTPARFKNRLYHLIGTMNTVTEKSTQSFRWAEGYILALANKLSPFNPDLNKILNDLSGFFKRVGSCLYDSDPVFHLTKRGINKLQDRYEYHLSKVFRLQKLVKEGSDPEFATGIFPNYLERYSITIFTSIGWAESEYLSEEIDGWSFFLTINPLTFTCKYSSNVPWVDQGVDLFHMDPRLPLNMPAAVNKNALMIVMDRLFTDIAENKSDILDQLYTKDENDTGLRTTDERVTLFITELVKQVRLNYSIATEQEDGKSSANSTDWYKWRSFNDGITIIVVGCVYIEMALDGPGLVDIALDHNLTKEEDWSDIFYDKQISDEDFNIDHNFANVEKLHCDGTLSVESDVLLHDISEICTSIMYQKMTEGDDNEVR